MAINDISINSVSMIHRTLYLLWWDLPISSFCDRELTARSHHLQNSRYHELSVFQNIGRTRNKEFVLLEVPPHWNLHKCARLKLMANRILRWKKKTKIFRGVLVIQQEPADWWRDNERAEPLIKADLRHSTTSKDSLCLNEIGLLTELQKVTHIPLGKMGKYAES